MNPDVVLYLCRIGNYGGMCHVILYIALITLYKWPAIIIIILFEHYEYINTRVQYPGGLYFTYVRY